MSADPLDQDVRHVMRPENSATGSAVKPEISSILVIQFRFMGDLVLVTSLLDNLRKHFPRARLAVFSDAGNRELLALRPDVEFIPHYRGRKGRRNIFRAFAGWFIAVRELRSRRFDVLIDCSNTRSGAIFSSLSAVALRIGFESHKWTPSNAYHQFAPAWGHGSHFLDRFLSPLEALGLPVLTREPDLRASLETEDRITSLLAKEGLDRKGYIAVHTGARVPGRQWPLAQYAEVIDVIFDRYGLRAVVIGGPDERELSKTVCSLSRSAPLDLVGELSPEELVAALADCRFFLGNDSGPMHVAAAAGVPVVALFGLQSPERWGPLGNGHVIVRPSMPCPCPFPDICRPPNPQATLCVRRITVDEVVDGVAVLMRG